MERAKFAETLVVAAGQKTKERDFWLKKLSGDWEKSTFAPDFTDRIEKRAPGKVEFQFPDKLFAAIMKLSGGSDIRIHMILLTGISILLKKYSYSNSGDIILGMPIYKQKMKGEFINTVLTVRNNLEETMSFKELLLQVKDTVIEAVENRNYPVELLLEKLNLSVTGDDDFPLFDAAVLLQNIHNKEDLAHTRHNLSFSFNRVEDRHLQGEVIYNRSLYKKETIDRITAHLIELLGKALRDPDAKLSGIDMLSDKEKKELLITFNGKQVTLPSDGFASVDRLFCEQAERTPDKIAVSSPYDKTGIYEAFQSTGGHVDVDLLRQCCFSKNPYMFQTGIEAESHTDSNDNDIIMIKTNRHNSVIVNANMLKLLDLFDGDCNMEALFSFLQQFNESGFTFSILSMSENDLLEVTFKFNDKAEIFDLAHFEFDDFVRLIRILYQNHLIERSATAAHDVTKRFSSQTKSSQENKISINKSMERSATAANTEDFRPDFIKSDLSFEKTAVEILSGVTKDIPAADVLLLGDTPGIPSTGLLYLASYLQRQGINACCRFYDGSLNYNELEKELRCLLGKIRPEVVGISMKWFPYIARVLDMCKIVKEYALEHSLMIKVVLGGNTASYYAEDIITDDCIDYVVCGDGEEPFLKICRGEADIPNCIYKKNGEIIKNPLTYIQDENTSRDIYLSHLDNVLLSDYAALFGTFFIYTHKGCVMNCLYCGGCKRAQHKTFNRKQVSRRGVGEVRKDILAARKYVSTFQFDFDIPVENLADYCKKAYEGIDLSGHFCVFSTLYPPGEQLIELVCRTFKYVYWDFDISTLSGRHRSELVSKGLVKPQPSDEDIFGFLERCEKYDNIEVRINLITGLPYFTIEDIEPSEKLLSRIMNRYKCFGELHWARLHAQPGAPIIDDAEKYGMHSYAQTFDDFLEYSRKNFDRQSDYPGLEYMNYPYIYFNDEKLNSRITRFYSENNLKIEQHRRDRRDTLVSRKDLSYRELNTESGRLAEILRSKGVTPGSIAALMLEPSIDTAVGILGILKAGAAYLPIDPEFPPERISYMLKDSSAAVLVTKQDVLKKEEKIRKWHGEFVFLDAGIKESRPVGGAYMRPNPDVGARRAVPEPTPPYGHPSGEGISRRGEPCVPPSPRAARPAYVIYTSGSTGKPKGVILSHKNLVNYVSWFSSETGLSEKDKTVLMSSFAFDLGYTAIYPSLLCGGELHLPDKQVYLLPERLLQYISGNEITYIKVTPSLFSLLVNCPDFTEQNCRSLRLVVLGGEPINVNDIERAHTLCPQIKIMNHYGPTEATIGCVATFVDFDNFAEYKENPVIGKPIFNTAVYIVDKDLNLLPTGVPGELCIAGSGLSRGYLNRPELTTEKFNKCFLGVQGAIFQKSPLAAGGKLYKTGDLARRLPNGAIEFLGRTDNQVKIRGYRIELEEITKRLLTHPGVEEAVVVDRKQDNGEKYLCAYLIEKKGDTETAEDRSLAGIISRLKAVFGEDFTGPQEVANPVLIGDFEDKVKNDPGKTALKSEEGDLTYESLDSWAERAAGIVREEYDDRFSLSLEEKERYKRQILLHGWGAASQEKLKSTTVFVAGAGGGASPIIYQLALAGIGTIKVCDFDTVELSNLNRQFLHDHERMDMNKALSCQQTVAKINPHVNVIPYTGKLTRENVFEMVGDSDIIFDMFDGLADKFILSECAAAKGIPHLVLAMVDLNAYAALLNPPDSPCYHCLFDKEKFDTIVSGMQSWVKNYQKNPLAVVSSSLFIPAGILVNEAWKILLGFENPAYNHFFYFNHRGNDRNFALAPRYQSMVHLFSDHFLNLCKEQGFDWETGWRGNFLEEFILEANPDCPLCGEKGIGKREKLRERMQKAENDSEDSETDNTRVGGQEKKAVALLADADAVVAAGIIAAVRSAKSCVLLEPEDPESKLIDILEDSQARIILTHNRYFSMAEKLRDMVNKNIRVIDMERVAPAADDDTKRYSLQEKSSKKNKILTHSHSDLRDFLLQELPEYMIPSYFVTLPEMPLTGNGKIDRKALPEPGISLVDDYTPPGNEMEEILVETWQEILGIDRVGIDDNFFELGLDSIKAIQVSSRLLQKGLKMEVRDIFENPTISKLAAKMSVMDRQIIQETVSGDVPLTPVQHWFFRNTHNHRHHFNMAVMLYKEDGIDEIILEQVFEKITAHHDALRMVYQIGDNTIRQRNRGVEPGAFSIEVMNIENEEEIERSATAADDVTKRHSSQKKSSHKNKIFTLRNIEKEANRLQRSIDLEKGPLIRLGLFKTKKGDHLLVVVHHLVMDGISWRILLEDLNSGYNQVQKGKEPVFPPKTDSFKNWAEKLAVYSTNKSLLKESTYWGKLSNTKLVPDRRIDAKLRKNRDNETLTLSLDKKETGKLLKDVNLAYNTEINDILLTALIMALNQWRNIDRVLIDLEGHGREEIFEDINISRTIGWFTTQYPVLLQAQRDLSYNIKRVKETLRKIPSKGIGYGVLTYLTPADQKKGSNFDHEAEISFNYLGQFGQENIEEPGTIGLSPLKYGDTASPEMENPYALKINGVMLENNLQLYFTTNKNEYKKASIEQLTDCYRSSLIDIINHCTGKKTTESTPSDLGYTGITIEELYKIEKSAAESVEKPVELEKLYPLTPGQQAFLTHTLENKAQRTQSILYLYGIIDNGLFQRAIDLLVERYDVLRTLFFYEDLTEPIQAVLKEKKLNVLFEDLSSLPEEEKQEMLEHIREEDWEKGFDTGKEVIRITLIKFADKKHYIFWTVHRNIVDGWSIGLLFRDFLSYYISGKDNNPIDLQPITPYHEYVKWIRNLDREKGFAYWQEYLKGYKKTALLPNANKPGKPGKFKLGEQEFIIDEKKMKLLNREAKKNNVTLNTLIQAIWGIMLQRYNNTEDVVFGATVSGRSAEVKNIENMVGLFVNSVPVRVNRDSVKTFSQLIVHMQKKSDRSKSHENMPTTEILSLSPLKRNLIDSNITFQNYPFQDQMKEMEQDMKKKKRDLDIGFGGGYSNFHVQTNFDMNIFVRPRGLSTAVEFSFNANVYHHKVIKEIIKDFRSIVMQLLKNPGISLDEIR